ncbi:hypothetical protein Mesau_00730 [Mesorhizobium australicum WSM2073]|uniref:Uncharacterized protein n=1 Tax=Mesorhizobium australicum (strain HAMBI 3006 / LMG 24608 / WSM2073) TaxID=754035 RepID=L0KDY2_MESAW|nr:hypothetical protein [Mesorhizobium australicum]AGB43216.1 hypothetical protein Mesau_00730 [Mesorhizobium australicum WSM2073]
MIKITGLDKLTKTLEQAQRALKEVDGELGTVSFDPQDPASIEAAIQAVETMIDQRLGRYETNPVIAPLIEGMKEQYRQGILDRAAEARLGTGGEVDGD